jgi:hypothetical protein
MDDNGDNDDNWLQQECNCHTLPVIIIHPTPVGAVSINVPSLASNSEDDSGHRQTKSRLGQG